MREKEVYLRLRQGFYADSLIVSIRILKQFPQPEVANRHIGHRVRFTPRKNSSVFPKPLFSSNLQCLKGISPRRLQAQFVLPGIRLHG